MKNYVKTAGPKFKLRRLLKAVLMRPERSKDGRPLASSSPSAMFTLWLEDGTKHERPLALSKQKKKNLPYEEAGNEVIGLFAKHNLQYRRPTPLSDSNIEHGCSYFRRGFADNFEYWQGGNYAVEAQDLRYTVVGRMERVDWDSWTRTKSSMVVPLYQKADAGSSDSSPAIGDRKEYLCQTVTAINFSGLCHLFGDKYTAAELEEAWLKMPEVKYGKPNRGRAAGKGRHSAGTWGSHQAKGGTGGRGGRWHQQGKDSGGHVHRGKGHRGKGSKK